MNTKEPQLAERFIELRAQGWTLARIAQELQVSKPTLIQWSRRHQHQIRNLSAIETWPNTARFHASNASRR